MTGRIRRVHEKGFGFIQGDDGLSYFCTARVVRDRGFDFLGGGERVEFVVDVSHSDARGPKAADVVVVGAEDAEDIPEEEVNE